VHLKTVKLLILCNATTFLRYESIRSHISCYRYYYTRQIQELHHRLIGIFEHGDSQDSMRTYYIAEPGLLCSYELAMNPNASKQ
jgi:hypothetical protein